MKNLLKIIESKLENKSFLNLEKKIFDDDKYKQPFFIDFRLMIRKLGF